MTPAVLYRVEIAHARLAPVRYRLRHRSYQWLVDLAELPKFRWPLSLLAGFDSRDHLGDPSKSIHDNIVDLCAGHGIDATGRILMLSNARVLGFVFNPLSVFWCHDGAGRLSCVVAEVHNTYGGRHHYLLQPDEHGRAEVAKGFYVSPFFDVDGGYRLVLPIPDRRLRLAVTLRHHGRTSLVATVSGRRRPVTTRELLLAAARHPLVTLQVSAAIRWHGVRLFLAGLPVTPRPVDVSTATGSKHPAQKGSP